MRYTPLATDALCPMPYARHHLMLLRKAIHRLIEGKIKTVTISKTPSGKYLASILTEVEGEHPTRTEGKIYGIDLGLKHFAVVTLGKKVSK
jgi:putative transposase